jgi:hypothetical protein
MCRNEFDLILSPIWFKLDSVGRIWKGEISIPKNCLLGCANSAGLTLSWSWVRVGEILVTEKIGWASTGPCELCTELRRRASRADLVKKRRRPARPIWGEMRKWAMASLGYRNLFSICKHFPNLKMILISNQIQTSNVASHNIKSNNTHKYKIKCSRQNATKQFCKA